jgi:hypothetical protein
MSVTRHAPPFFDAATQPTLDQIEDALARLDMTEQFIEPHLYGAFGVSHLGDLSEPQAQRLLAEVQRWETVVDGLIP